MVWMECKLNNLFIDEEINNTHPLDKYLSFQNLQIITDFLRLHFVPSISLVGGIFLKIDTSSLQ